ncbi:unnamed protein product [Brugia timori]|uniref:Uncharacterized protein n=1 Tax=Brugia timori TaxID=42155 RepID=A0A0R3QWW1_9BILA|nr:unnamed protein product [Brugia timori]
MLFELIDDRAWGLRDYIALQYDNTTNTKLSRIFSIKGVRINPADVVQLIVVKTFYEVLPEMKLTKTMRLKWLFIFKMKGNKRFENMEEWAGMIRKWYGLVISGSYYELVASKCPDNDIEELESAIYKSIFPETSIHPETIARHSWQTISTSTQSNASALISGRLTASDIHTPTIRYHNLAPSYHHVIDQINLRISLTGLLYRCTSEKINEKSQRKHTPVASTLNNLTL